MLETESPGKAYIAETFGAAIPGVKGNELLSGKDYQKVIGGKNMPRELEKALSQYVERVKKQQYNKDEKVTALMDFLTKQKTSKRPIDKQEIDLIVQ